MDIDNTEDNMAAPSPSPQRHYSTAELARLVRNQSSSIATALHRKGHFLGLKPAAKLPNGRLLWDADEADRLVTNLQGGGQ